MQNRDYLISNTCNFGIFGTSLFIPLAKVVYLLLLHIFCLFQTIPILFTKRNKIKILCCFLSLLTCNYHHLVVASNELVVFSFWITENYKLVWINQRKLSVIELITSFNFSFFKFVSYWFNRFKQTFCALNIFICI